ncbi:tripartite tricarboxylate transporter substrate binding protein [Variovorax sp. WS11]|uniref:Bug family tripartite tricarboxylate transporter substrate binding protein n=1 Tax=Variovorax sp. WS11 TaxID=1105204 RepID=UPI0013D9D80C|nr:tripartite tricarboxylate transporter substrate binding protein [Variovorax sp. WS11]NDZ18756.1 tripartite tricarboxylate transporter substrate binding protein [Variovorax sp. WS11]
MKRSFASLIASAAVALPALLAAQTFPSKPVTFVVPFGPAAGADMIARSIATTMSKHLGQPAVVDNKPGGNAFIGSQAVLNAPADGHTVLISSNSPVIFNKLLFKSMPYDSIKDFIPVAGFCSGSVVVTVHSKSRFHNVAELVEYGRKNPGKLTVAYSSSATQLAAAMFQQLSGVKMLEVPYRAFAPALNAQLGEEVDLLFPPPDLVAPHIRSGALRPLAVTGSKRMASLWPDVPTLQEAGIKAYEFTFWYGAWAKEGTPMSVVDKLRNAMLHALDEPDGQKFLAANACEPMRMTRPEFAKFQQQELEKWGKVVREAGIQPQ